MAVAPNATDAGLTIVVPLVSSAAVPTGSEAVAAAAAAAVANASVASLVLVSPAV